MIKLKYTREQLRDEREFVVAIRDALELHVRDFIPAIKKDKEFYLGEQPKVQHVFNKAKYTIDMATEMFIGEMPEFTTYSLKEKQRKRLYEFNKKLRASDFARELYNTGHYASMTGSGFLLVYLEDNDTFPRYVALDPEFTNVVYDTSVKPKPTFAFTLLKQTELRNNNKVEYYRVFVYTDEYFYDLRTVNTTDLTITNDLPLLNFDTETSTIVRHPFGQVPIVQFMNNINRIGDARPGYDLITAYNHVQNARKQNIDDMTKYVLMLKNVRVGNEEEQENFVNMLKNHRVLALEGDNADARFLQNALDQSDIQRLADDLDSQYEIVVRVPNFNKAEFAQNSSEPALKLKLKGFFDLAKEKERYFSGALSDILGMTLGFLQEYGGRESVKYIFDMNDMEIEYSHNLPSNDMDKITQFVSLNQLGLLNKRIALQQLSWIKNVEEYIEGMENEPVGQQAEMLSNGGNNATNRQRQLMAGANPSEVDNVLNNARGVAQNLTTPPNEE